MLSRSYFDFFFLQLLSFILIDVYFQETFHAIIYCGATSHLPRELTAILDNEGGSIIAPVKISTNQQQLQMCITSSDGETEIRKINDFGVIFEDAK